MDINFNHIPLGSVLELGGDTMKRRLYFGEVKNGFCVLWKTEHDFMTSKPWEVMAEPSSRIKNITLPIGFDKDSLLGWIRDRVK